MIQVCPHCGHDLECGLIDGLTHCKHCNQVLDASDYNRLLAAGWQVRRERLSLEELRHRVGLPEDEAILVHTFVCEYGYTHEEFLRVLRKLGVAHKSYIKYG